MLIARSMKGFVVRRTAIALLSLSLAAACSACGQTPDSTTTLTVFAASSLTGAFTTMAADYRTANPGTTVTLNFGPSDGLAAQIESESTADVFASASGAWMDDVRAKVGVTNLTTFAANRLVIITPPSNPANIAGLADLTNPGVQLVLAAPGVPVGDYARAVLKNAGIAEGASANIVSNAQDDAGVVATVANGEADAAIVYLSDVTAKIAPTVHSIDIPGSVNISASYPIAVVNGTAQPAAAAAFVDYVNSPPGRSTLARFGFLPPTKE
jgi:molybdate transport system substrate-binding protein